MGHKLFQHFVEGLELFWDTAAYLGPFLVLKLIISVYSSSYSSNCNFYAVMMMMTMMTLRL
jgi:hypothetical protein